MRKCLLIAALLLASAVPAHAQNTAVTATVVDVSGIPYAGARVSAQLVPTGTNPTINGQAISAVAFSQLDANGALNMNLFDNGLIVPGGTQWQITVCETPGVQPPLGTGSQCFMVTVTITGATQSLTTAMNAVAPALTYLNIGGGNFANRALSNLTAPTAINQQLLAGSGTVAVPSYSFTASPGSGMFWNPNQVCFGLVGVSQLCTNGGAGITSSGTVCMTTNTRCWSATTLPTSLDHGIAATGGLVAMQWPLVAGNPATAGWAAPEKGNTFFNTATNLPRYWNGSALVDFGAAAPGSDQQVTYNDMGTAAGATGLLWDKVNNRVGIVMSAGQSVDPLFLADSALSLKGSFKLDGGLYFPYFNAGLSTSVVPTASTGDVRFSKTGTLKMRNNGNTGDVTSVSLNASDQTLIDLFPPVPIVGTVSLLNQTMNLGPTTILTSAATDSLYHVDASLVCKGTSAAATVLVTIAYTDVSGTAQTISSTVATCTALGANSVASFSTNLSVQTSTAISYTTTIANTPTYDIRVAVTKIL